MTSDGTVLGADDPAPSATPWLATGLSLVVVVVSLGRGRVWLHHFRLGYPLDIDESRYLELGLRLSDGLRSGGPSRFWHVWSAQHDFGPLLPLASVPVLSRWGRHCARGANHPAWRLLALLVVASYGLGRRLTSPAGGVVVALVVACAPSVIDFSRSYQFAVTDAAVLAAATYALLASEALTRRGWSLVWGLLVGLLPLARTMALAFVPAQLIGALWLIWLHPDGRSAPGAHPGEGRPARGRQWGNLALALGVGAAAAASWLAYSWHSVFSYLTGFGYGGASGAFSHSGSRLAVGYWTREAVDLVRQDLYLPLAALLVVCLVAGGAGGWRKRRGVDQLPFRSRLRGWAASEHLVVLFVLLEGYLAVSSSRNEGVGFRVPLIAELAALAVAALFAVPWRAIRSGVLAALVAACALNLVMKADIWSGSSSRDQVSLPGLGSVPVLDGLGYIQSYVIASDEGEYASATAPLPVSQRGWLPAYVRIVATIFRLARASHHRPVVDLATDEPLLNVNDLTLAARLRYRRELVVNLLPGPPGPATFSSYQRLLGAAQIQPNVLVTVTHVGLSYFALSGRKDIQQGLLEQASEARGFSCGAGVPLPDGRVAVVSWRPPRSTGRPTSSSCLPRVVRVSPASGRWPRGGRWPGRRAV